jgi:hypothetical protein
MRSFEQYLASVAKALAVTAQSSESGRMLISQSGSTGLHLCDTLVPHFTSDE